MASLRRRTLLAVLAATLAAATGLAAAPADAATGVKYGVTDDAWLQSGPGSLESRLARLQTLGVKVVRFTLNWNPIAPGEARRAGRSGGCLYDWSKVDPVLMGLRARAITVLLQLNGVPTWANGGRPSNYAPTSATTFRDFATAAAQRYPWVKRWLVWNEPNQARWLRPTSASIYTTRLLNPAYLAIHRVSPACRSRAAVPLRRGSSGGVSPVAWLAGMRAAHARLDAYAHNPYPLDPKRETPYRGGCTNCATITMATLNKLVGLVARSFPRARIWLTEYGYQTNPPDRLLGVSPALQARYVGEGAYAAYRTARVDLLIHFLVRDEPNLARFQSGLLTLAGKAKPALPRPTSCLWRRSHVRARRHVALGTAASARRRRLPHVIERRLGRGLAHRPQPCGREPGRFFRWTGTLPRGTQVRLHAGTTHRRGDHDRLSLRRRS